MSFRFGWPLFDNAFYNDAREMLTQALNKGDKPPIIADRIEVRELQMGTVPPELEMLEIGDLSKERFRGIFRLTYTGDAFIELQTVIQANPLNQNKPVMDALPTPSILFASAPLKVPMRLKLSGLRLRAIIVLVVSKQKGITLVFKNDPLESVTVSSTFDSVAVIQGFIQREIEGQLREMFRADLPGIIHRLSQRWLADSAKAAPDARNKFDPSARIETRTEQTGDISSASLRSRASAAPSSVASSPPRRTSMYRPSTSNLAQAVPSRPKPSRLASDFDDMSVADSIEFHDPSYGLRPEGLTGASPVRLQGRLWSSGAHGTRGLGDVLAEDSELDDAPEADESYDMFSESSFSPSSVQEYETYPAIGGGFITRPRVLHSQSQLFAPRRSSRHEDESLELLAGQSEAGSSRWPGVSSSRSADHLHRVAHSLPITPLRSVSTPHYFASRTGLGQRSVGSSSHTSPRTALSRDASSMFVPTIVSSRSSLEPPTRSPSPPAKEDDDFLLEDYRPPSPPPLLSPATAGVILTTSANNDRCAHLTTLSQTHSTLSPLTRHHEHVAARSHVLTRASKRDELPVVTHGFKKARRRRLHVLGSSREHVPMEQPSPRQRTITETSAVEDLDWFFPRSTQPSPELERRPTS